MEYWNPLCWACWDKSDLVVSVFSVGIALIMDRLYLAMKQKYETIQELRFIRDFAYEIKSIPEYEEGEIEPEEEAKIEKMLENCDLKLNDFLRTLKLYSCWFPTSRSDKKRREIMQTIIDDADKSIGLIQEYGRRKAKRILEKTQTTWKKRILIWIICVILGVLVAELF